MVGQENGREKHALFRSECGDKDRATALRMTCIHPVELDRLRGLFEVNAPGRQLDGAITHASLETLTHRQDAHM